MVLAVYDRDISDDIVEDFPELYKQGHGEVFFNKWSFYGWVANSIYHSAVCFSFPFIVYHQLPSLMGKTLACIHMVFVSIPVFY